MFLKGLLLILSFAVLHLPVAAKTFYVSTTGDNDNPGTEELPYRTMRKALQRLWPGDILYVRGGEYRETLGGDTPIVIRPGRLDAPINIIAYPGERPVLRGMLHLHRPSHWTLDGINVTWKSTELPNRHMVKITDGVGWTIKNGEFWGARAHSAILVAGTGGSEPSDWRIAYCVVHDTFAANENNQDHLLYINTGLNAGIGTIERNILYNATNGHGIKLGSWEPQGGSANVTVRYNTIYNTVSSVFISWASTNNRVYRNMFEKVLGREILIRGYQLTGTGNTAFENAGRVTNHFVFSDEGYQQIEEANNVPITPALPHIIYGFVILNPKNGLALYGRYADPPDP